MLCALRSQRIEPREVHLVATSRAPVEEAVEIARRCPCPGGGGPPLSARTSIVVYRMRVGDVVDEDGVRELLEKLGEAVRGAGEAVIDVTGGRKLASIIAAMFAVRRGYTAVYTPIPHEEQRRIDAARDPCGKTARTPVRPIIL